MSFFYSFIETESRKEPLFEQNKLLEKVAFFWKIVNFLIFPLDDKISIIPSFSIGCLPLGKND